ncbi:UDP-N-acetylmuramoyl-L-alanine--D-glutamate ligase, partial [Candidatus Roizmanbacteria bacterium]|nr:UDP-N-acetylmuramoyl-L-alanine--D-glutamate ligase [Candidatus Roizmanbacteria bacterium]
MNVQNKKIAILGAGIEGVSSAIFFKNKGAQVTVLDQKGPNEIGNDVIEQLRTLDIKEKFGKDYLVNLTQYDIIVRSPGIKLSTIQEVLPKDSWAKITSQTKLFFDLCPSQIIGVTGTKGKGTTATLIYEMLKKSGRDAYLGGNIGKPAFEFLDQLTQNSTVVLELSSFQVQDLTKSPHIGVVLMITSEHLDYHTDVYEYINAKRNILRFQSQNDYAVINRDYLASHESDIYTEGKVYQVSRERGVWE